MSGQLTCSGKVIDLLLRFNFYVVRPFWHQSASYIVRFHNVLQSERRKEKYEGWLIWLMFRDSTISNKTNSWATFNLTGHLACILLVLWPSFFSTNQGGAFCPSPWALRRQVGQSSDEQHCENFSTSSRKSVDIADTAVLLVDHSF